MAENSSAESLAKAPVSTEQAGSSSSFGDDDLGRIQGILFGDHARKTEERLNVMEIALLGAIADLREETTGKLDAIEAKVTAESETRDRAVSNLGSRIGRDITDQTAKVDDLRSEVESVEANMKKTIDATEATMVGAIDSVRVESQKGIDEARSEIGDDKVDRVGLSKMLRDLSDQLDPG